jgi:tetratricopeptide (TPR) repeat protein
MRTVFTSVAIAKIADYMQFSFPSSSLAAVLVGALLPTSAVFGQQMPEASHRERFAPREQALEKAEQELDTKIADHPDDPHLLTDRGLLRLDMNRKDEALADMRKAVELQPNDSQSHVNLAYGMIVSGQNSAAIDEARRALSLNANNAAAHALLGRTLVASDNTIREGIDHLQRSLEIFPDQPDLRFDLISALRKTGDYAAAGIQLRILKDSLPSDNLRLQYTQGLLFADLGHPEAAAASFRRALAHDPDFEGAFSPDPEVRKAFNPEPDLLPIWQDLGVALVHSGKWNEAAGVLGGVGRARPGSFPVAYMNALALQNSGNTKLAENEVRRAISLNEKSADAHTLLGITLSSESRFKEAIVELESAVELDPGSFDAQMYLGRARYGLSDAPGAAAALQEAVKLRSSDSEARFLLGTVLEIAGDKDGATAQYRELVTLSPNDPRGYLGLGSILSKYGQNDEAIQQLQHAHALAPENFEANMALGRLLAKTGKFDESIPSLEEASREQPDSPEAHYQLALSLQRAGRAEQASQEFAEVERLNQQRRSGSEMPKP